MTKTKKGYVSGESDETELKLSIQAISGMLGCSTMKFEGMVNSKRLQLLID